MEQVTREQLEQMDREQIIEWLMAAQEERDRLEQQHADLMKERTQLERQAYILEQLGNGKQIRLHKQIPEV